MERFRYSPMAKDQIRLFRFKDSPSKTTTISLDLKCVPRDASVKYTAVSYAWGSVTNHVAVEVNGCSFVVGHNLFALLEQFRAHGVTGPLWIDALCINQADNNEKSWHVNEMKQIFEGAAMVYIWLGPSADDSDLAMDFIRDLIHHCDGKLEDLKLLYTVDKEIAVYEALHSRFPQWAISIDDPYIINRWNSSYREHFVRALSTYQPDKTMITALDFVIRLFLDANPAADERVDMALWKLVSRDLWDRVWIFQEIAVAKDAMLFCGDRRISLDDFMAALAVLQVWCDVLGAATERYLDGPRFYHIAHNSMLWITGLIIREERQRGSIVPLHRLLLHHCSRRPYHATDARDVLFSLLGVTDAESRYNIIADYGKSTQQIFIEATRALIFKSDLADRLGPGITGQIIMLATHEKEITVLPSWVPDWKAIGASNIHQQPVFSYVSGVVASGRKLQPTENSGWDEKSNFGVLRMYGAQIAKVDRVLACQARKEDLLKPSSASLLRRAADFSIQVQPHGGHDAFCRVLFDDYDPYRIAYGCGPGRISDWPKPFPAAAVRFIREVVCDGEPVPKVPASDLPELWGLSWVHPIYNLSNPQQVRKLAAEVLNLAYCYLESATIFATTAGALARGTDKVKVGDIVAVLWEVNIPVILRETKAGRYKLVSGAYVDGVMHGQVSARNPSDQIFDLE